MRVAKSIMILDGSLMDVVVGKKIKLTARKPVEVSFGAVKIVFVGEYRFEGGPREQLLFSNANERPLSQAEGRGLDCPTGGPLLLLFQPCHLL
jgi:hypothetical protein